jgi:hypothetical protein
MEGHDLVVLFGLAIGFALIVSSAGGQDGPR